MRISESNVVQQIKLKNEQSITFVLQEYGGLLQAIARKYMQGRPQDIEECIADVLVSIWFNIDAFDPSKNEFKQWIAAITKYRAIDYVRKLERNKEKLNQLESHTRLWQQSDAGAAHYDWDTIFSELSEVERHIFEQYYFEGIPSQDIAKDYEAKPSWVHNKLSRGRRKLKQVLLRDEV